MARELPSWPALMRRQLAAEYLNLTPASLEGEVAAGRLPCPLKIAGQERWSKSQIDKALAIMGGEETQDWRAGSPLYSGAER